MKTLTNDQADAINFAAQDAGVVATAYSGRAMFGRYCLGISTGHIAHVARFLVALAREDADLAGSLALNLRTDELGLGIIAYFPSFDSAGRWADEGEDDEI